MKTAHLTTALLASFFALGAAPALAATCSVDIQGSDAMQYNKSSIEVPASCKQFTVNLSHPGKMPRTTMGHNWVLSKTTDFQAIATDGIPAGIDKSYIKDGDKRVIASTKIIGSGESTSVTFDVNKLKAGEAYTYFCTFPGHVALMKGTLTVTK